MSWVHDEQRDGSGCTWCGAYAQVDDENLCSKCWHLEIVKGLLDQLEEIRSDKKALRAREMDVVALIHETQKAAGLKKRFDTRTHRVTLAHSINRRWDTEELVRHVVGRALDERHIDHDTGEVEPSHQVVTRVLMECAHIDYWRMKELSSHGLQPDEFYEETSRSLSVRIVPLTDEGESK